MKHTTCYISSFSILFLLFVSFHVISGEVNISEKRNSMITMAKKYMGTKYIEGGASPAGFDCSGFVMYIYKRFNIQLPRTCREQFKAGKEITVAEALPGDIVCFKTYKDIISHVGIYIGNSEFIHAAYKGKGIRIDSINDKYYWKEKFFAVVRIEALDSN